MDKKLGVFTIALMLCFSVFLAIGDNSVTAVPPNSTGNTIATVTIGDVIGITVPTAIANNYTGWDSFSNLQLLVGGYGGTTNNITSQSNGKIDVYVKSDTGSFIPNNNSTEYPDDVLTNFRYSGTDSHVTNGTFSDTWVKAIDDWKITQNETAADATINLPIYVNIPTFTAEGTYNTTIRYIAVRNGIILP